MADFGKVLKQARKSRKWTQKELANRLGVEQSTISNYENSARLPVAPALVEIANELNVSVDYLLGRSDSSHYDRMSEVSNEASDIPLAKGSDISDLSEDVLEALRTNFFLYLQQGRFADVSDLVRTSSLAGSDLLVLYETLVQPTLKKIGDLWESGKISVADEHMVSELIDRLLVLISTDKRKPPMPKKPLTVVLMLPGAERHEFPLKILSDVFRKRGWKTYYLGMSVPTASLQDFLRKKHVDVLALSVTIRDNLNGCGSLIQSIKTLPKGIPPIIIVGGNAVNSESEALNDLSADLYFPTLRDLNEGIEMLEHQLKK